MLVFAVTILLSSFLLFLVQPMIARMILPWFGGTAAVWSTCLVFFQVTLLFGYLYSHKVITRLPLRRQRLVHSLLLALCVLFLPLWPSASWKPAGGEDPMLRILGLLVMTVGLPYFLLSTTGPLIQAWLVQARPGAIPYRLFALSNFGSMLALICYPTLIEPRLGLRQQSWLWSGGFGLFLLVSLAAGWASLPRGATAAAQANDMDEGETPPAPRMMTRVDWVLLATCPSILLLALTNSLTQDVAAIPFLWVIPLALYLLSFILCFDMDRWYRRWIFLPLGWLAAFMLVLLTMGGLPVIKITPVVTTISMCFFIVCMNCHGELARRKPHPKYLTLFYLMVSLGGALGGVFVAILAPLLFRTNYELPVGLSLFVYVLVMVMADVSEAAGRRLLKPVSITIGLVFFMFLGYRFNMLNRESAYSARNFYGELKIAVQGDEEDWGGIRRLVNGSINHGEEFIHPKRRSEPTTYYCPDSGVGMALSALPPGPAKVAIVGLGAGTLASYSRPGDLFRFYEINPLVVEVSKKFFYYVSEAKGKIDVVMGDARLSLEREAPQNYDVIAIDAFSSDSIPVHLLTREAIQLYFRHLKPGGILAIHVSNRYIDLEPVLEQQALRAGKYAATVDSRGDGERRCYQSVWVILTAREDLLKRPDFLRATRPTLISVTLPLWTDDYSNVFQLLK